MLLFKFPLCVEIQTEDQNYVYNTMTSMFRRRLHIEVQLFNEFEGSVIKTLDTFSNCHRPVFSHGVSQDMHQICENLS